MSRGDGHVAARARGWTLPRLAGTLAGSDTGRAAGLAAAVLATNLLGLVFTIVFARILGPSGYGSLAALVSAFIVLMVPGAALQLATAREVSHATVVGGAPAGSGVRRWLRQLTLAAVAVAVLAILLRSTLASVIHVDQVWAAAAVPVTAMMWAIVSVERGALQGFQRYRLVGFSLVGEAVSRLVFALPLVAAGLGVTGAFLGTGVGLLAVGLSLAVPLHRRLPAAPSGEDGGVRQLLAGFWAPVLGLTLLFALQEVPVIIVKHEATSAAAGWYAAAAVAAKAIIWVAVGLGMYLLPETARRAGRGVDPRPILLRMLALIAAASAPMVLICAVAGGSLLGAVFGDDLTGASQALPWLSLSMALLACTYLSVQYLLALGRSSFIWALAAAAAAQVLLLTRIGDDLTGVALALFGLQAVCAASLLALSLRQARATRGGHAPYIPV
jgi:O-antigen/teichoic acid export membrane protein